MYASFLAKYNTVVSHGVGTLTENRVLSDRLPSAEELLVGCCLGDYTVECDNESWGMFPGPRTWVAMLEENVMTESPEKVAGKYKRDNYSYLLFLGDHNGYFIGEFKTHGDLLRSLVSDGTVTHVNGKYSVNQHTRNVIGNPETVSVYYSGTILPRQEGVDGTYISYWTARSENPLVLKYVKHNFNGPYWVERNLNDSFEENWQVTTA